jgi:hypothetical protein
MLPSIVILSRPQRFSRAWDTISLVYFPEFTTFYTLCFLRIEDFYYLFVKYAHGDVRKQLA